MADAPLQPTPRTVSQPGRLYVQEADVECFGRYRHERIGPFVPGLNIVFGANEAGKSTLASFFGQVVFGWSTFRQSSNPYEPFSGKVAADGTVVHPKRRTREGSIVFSNGIDSWELARDVENQAIAVPRVGRLQDNAYRELVADIDDATYGSVFSFSSSAISSFDAKDNALSKLLSASSGGFASPVDVYENLVDEVNASGSDQTKVDLAVKRLKREYGAALEEERALQARSAALLDVRCQATLLEDEMVALDRQRADLLERSGDVTAASNALDQLEETCAAEEKQLARARMEEKRLRSELAERHSFAPAEQLLLQHEDDLAPLQDAASAYRDAHERARGMQARADEAVCALDASRRAEGPLLENPTPGLRAQVDEAAQERMRACAHADQTRRAYDDERLDHEQRRAERARLASIDERNARRASQLAHSTRQLLISYAILLAVAVGTALVGWASDAPFNYWLAAVEGIVGTVALIVVLARRGGRAGEGHGSQDARRQQDAHSPQDAGGSQDARRADDAYGLEDARDDARLERARIASEQADARVAAFDQEVSRWLGEQGFKRAGGTLEDARVEWERADERSALERAVHEAEAQLEQAAGTAGACERSAVDAARPFDASVADGAAAERLTARLAKQMPELHRRHAAQLQVQASLASTTATAKAAQDRLASATQAVQEQCALWGAERVDDARSRMAKERSRLDDETAEVERALSEKTGRAGECRQRLADGLDESALEEAKRSSFALQAKLRAAQLNRARLVIAQQIMQQSIEAWEKDAAPELVSRANAMLRLITDGAWTEVRITPERNIVVVNASHESYVPDYLSTGTLQQVYLALRIAVLVTADQVGQGLPVMADDILVHFDDERRGGAARALIELARHRQVIISTSHREVVMLLQRLDTDAKLINL